jgi:hypothetical protein
MSADKKPQPLLKMDKKNSFRMSLMKKQPSLFKEPSNYFLSKLPSVSDPKNQIMKYHE